MPDPVSYEVVDGIAIITIDNPPVNALSHAVRLGCWEALDKLAVDDSAQAAVLIGKGRTFIAGADITEFDKPVQDPWLPELVDKLEAADKITIAAIHGVALGGGLEVAMGCHYRIAVEAARVGLPEVALGLHPGAGGTQRLPRLAGVKQALDMMLSGRPIPATVAQQHGIIDEIIEDDLPQAAIAYAKTLLKKQAGVRRLSEQRVDSNGIDQDFFAEYEQRLAKTARGFFSPGKIVQCVKAALEHPYKEGMVIERRLFDECKASPHSLAQRHLFFAEREIARIPDVPKDTPARDITSVAIIGAGTMGSGIAMNFIAVGIPVTLLEADQQQLQKGLERIRKYYTGSVDKGKLTAEQLQKNMALITPATAYSDIADADLVIEAVFENMAVKKEVFSKLNEVCKPGAILATNTSSLDINELATATKRPQDIIGLHFFAPANVMPLLEIVRADKTAKDVIATAMALAKRIRKVGVLAGVCFGFIGNRMFFPYLREAELMLLEGIPPERVDQVAFDWGMAMGPHAVADLSGLDVFQKLMAEWPDRPDDPAYYRICEVLVEMGRLGQKTGAGIYKYEGRKAVPDPEVMQIAAREAATLSIEPCQISDEEIVQRMLCAMINEGALLLEEGIALRPGDIDVVFVNGYGMPRYRGGPMHYADTIGLKNIYDAVCKYRSRYGDRYWTPAPLLEQLAQQDQTFAEWSAARQ
ncbi:MAG: 3-hydroxyacyl-CoA dehydrogenase NAD-binding domain-containing protein [Gammaproteobacteria bacterium]